ncbi:MAG: tRNA 2-thiocytidine biosynthesis protein TtcA [Ruminococcaceae bacterium]|nr:tRNA 2-thiocytidine biosynthesis protein TtcA [Oscillospiraceae bacterium]
MNTIYESLHGDFASSIHRKFIKAVDEYRLFKAGDRVAVCISGGKDSMLMGALFREYERHGRIPITVKYLVMNPGYSDENFTLIKDNAARLELPIASFDTEIFKNTERCANPCFLCAKMRRGHLYNKARELGCNKIALGHHFDDVIESILMGMIYGGQVQTMLPRVKSANFEGMELVRPLYYVRERDIKAWRDSNGLRFLNCACRVTTREDGSKRKLIKRLIARLREDNPQIEQNIFRSVCNVRLDRLMSYKINDEVHDFLENFGDEMNEQN